MINKKYRDNLFRFIYSHKDNRKFLLSLYNALSGSNCQDSGEIKITTIKDVIYLSRKNDVSFLIDSQMYLLEQQSTYNPNMPVRGLLYFAQLYNKEIRRNNLNIFGSKQVKLPAPRYYVFYNGSREMADCTELKLSDAFEVPSPQFEWTATLLNINIGHNLDLLDRCKSLKDYSTYVNMVEENRKRGLSLEESILDATSYAKKMNLLEGFFEEHESEVLEMVLTEYNQKLHEKSLREEGREEGLELASFNIAVNLLKLKIKDEDILQATGMSPEQLVLAKAKADE